MKKIYLILLFVPFLFGCMKTTYTWKIKDEPFYIHDAFREGRESRSKEESSSLFKGDTFSNLFFSDLRAKRVGDIIVVKIVEVTSATEKAKTDTGRQSEINAGITGLFGLETRYPARHVIDKENLITASTKNTFSGSGETTRQGVVTATISAKVVEVLSNGNLAIEGRREILVNNEKKEILVRGVIRQSDIDWDNSILSTQICDAKIVMTGIGVIAEKQGPGWFTRIFDAIWPF